MARNNRISIKGELLERYKQTAEFLGLDYEKLIEHAPEGPDQISIRKDGSLYTEGFGDSDNLAGYLRNYFIIVSPQQADIEESLRTPTNSLANRAIDYLFSEPNRKITLQILEYEPIIGRIEFENDKGEKNNKIPALLELIAKDAIPNIYPEEERKKEFH